MIARALCVALTLLGGCVGVEHRPLDTEPRGSAALNEGIESAVTDAYFAALPDCATVLPAGGDGLQAETVLEAALTRHARDRFARVIGGPQRQKLAGRLRVDLSVPEDRAYFARRTRCAHFLAFRPIGEENVYAVVWSRRSLGIDAWLSDAAGETTLWRARTVAARSDGSLPLSPFGALAGAFEATVLASDAEIPQSLADDVARRVVATLPDLGLSSEPAALAPAFLSD